MERIVTCKAVCCRLDVNLQLARATADEAAANDILAAGIRAALLFAHGLQQPSGEM